MFGYLAGITQRIRFATGILVLPQRQTALVARQATDVDLLSGGRLRLGVGVGWNHVEYQALGQDFRTRGARQEEQIQLLRRLFTEPLVDFAGRFHRIDRAVLLPKPARPIPIWLGGHGEKAFDRAARLADGFIFFGGALDQVVDAFNGLRDRVHSYGRSVEDFGADWVLPSGRRRRINRPDRRVAAGRGHPCNGADGRSRPGLRRRPHRPPDRDRIHTRPAMTVFFPDAMLCSRCLAREIRLEPKAGAFP